MDRAFGLGCIAFEWRNPDMRNEDWAAAVTEALNGLANVSDVSVKVAGFIGAAPSGPHTKRGNVRETFYPNPCPALVEFTIHIPRRLQGEFTLRPTIQGAETFAVHLHYDILGPVAFFVALDGDPSVPADAGVVVVRKYLEKHLTGDISVTTVGPSPFHSAFFLEPSDELDRPLELAIERQEGYDRHYFKYRKADFGSPEDAFLAVLNTLRREGSLYYYVIRQRNRRMDRSLEIAHETDRLIAMHTAHGFKARLSRLFRGGGRARDLMLGVLRADVDNSRDNAIAAERIQSHYAANTLPALRAEVESEARAESREYLENARGVAELLERSRGKEFELLVIAASTILGGLAGAVAALIAGH